MLLRPHDTCLPSHQNSNAHAEEPLRVVVLYSAIVHYVIGVLKALHRLKPAEIDVVHWDSKGINSSRYILEKVEGIRFHARSELDDKGILELLRARRPHVIWISGWMDRGYLRALRTYRTEFQDCQVVCGIDDQWHGTLRQRLGQVYFAFFYRRLFDFMWIAGKPQYHYAQRFGYGPERIISNLLSADTARFTTKVPVNKRFVFVGRFDPVKGLNLLLSAYHQLPEAIKQEWPLVLIGDGELRPEIERKASKHVKIMPFLQLEELLTELSAGGVACITSRHEQWGVAIHEMALLGYPLVLSSACGAATEFLIPGYNGYLFRSGNVSSLKTALEHIASLPSKDLAHYSEGSRLLGQRISSELAAHSLRSVADLAKL